MKIRIIVLLILINFTSCFADNYSSKYPYDIVHAKFGEDNFGSIKINRSTGETWNLGIGNIWVKTEEEGRLKRGLYKVIMVSGKKNWEALRMNMENGESWRFVNRRWVKVLEAQ